MHWESGAGSLLPGIDRINDPAYAVGVKYFEPLYKCSRLMDINRERWHQPSMDLGQSAQSDNVRPRSAVIRQPPFCRMGPLAFASAYTLSWSAFRQTWRDLAIARCAKAGACRPSLACLNKRLVFSSKVFIFHERLFSLSS